MLKGGGRAPGGERELGGEALEREFAVGRTAQEHLAPASDGGYCSFSTDWWSFSLGAVETSVRSVLPRRSQVYVP